MKMHNQNWTRQAACLVAVAALLAGCGGADATGPQDASSAAVDGTEDASDDTATGTVEESGTDDDEAAVVGGGLSTAAVCEAIEEIELEPLFAGAATFAEMTTSPEEGPVILNCEARMQTPYEGRLLISTGSAEQVSDEEDVESGMISEENLVIVDDLGEGASILRVGNSVALGVVVGGDALQVSLADAQAHEDLPLETVQDGLIALAREILDRV